MCELCGRRGSWTGVVLFLIACPLAGCVKSGQLPTARVTGRIAYRGQPLAHGEIKFFPVQESGEGVRVAYGTLDAHGHYRLGTYREGDGALVGEHRVAIQCSAPTATEGEKKGDVPEPPRWLIPSRYTDPATSGLTAHVVRGNNTLDFDLKE